MNRRRWLSFLLVFLILTFFWISLATAASPHQSTEIPIEQAIPTILVPSNPTFGITIGAIVLVTIVITGAAFRKVRGS